MLREAEKVIPRKENTNWLSNPKWSVLKTYAYRKQDTDGMGCIYVFRNTQTHTNNNSRKKKKLTNAKTSKEVLLKGRVWRKKGTSQKNFLKYFFKRHAIHSECGRGWVNQECVHLNPEWKMLALQFFIFPYVFNFLQAAMCYFSCGWMNSENANCVKWILWLNDPLPRTDLSISWGSSHKTDACPLFRTRKQTFWGVVGFRVNPV